MVITLYKSCKFNQSYNEVLDTIKSVTYNNVVYTNTLEAYLSTLTKYTVTTVEPIFFTNSGKFPFEYDLGLGGNIYDYNYMKVEEVIPKDDNTNVSISRYFFINSITLVNIIAVADYTEDIWANYSKSMHLRKSLLVRSRATKYGSYTVPFYKLGMEYEGNNAPSISSLKTVYDATDAGLGKCAIIAQIQLYQLTQQGKASNIITRTCMLRDGNVSFTENPINTTLFNLLTQIVAGQANKKFIFNNLYATNYNISTSGDWYYEINNFILVPYKMGLANCILTSEVAYTMGNIDGMTTLVFGDLARTFCNSSSILANGQPIQTTTFSITNDFKNLGVGTYTSFYEIVSNGSTIDGSIVCASDDYNFNIFIRLQNQVHNITENYSVNIPISVQTADVTQQQKTARQLELMNTTFNIGKGIIGIYSGANSISSGVANTALGATTGQIGNVISGKGMIASGVKELYGGVTGIAKGIANLIVLNKPLYRTNKGTFSKSIGLINAYSGLMLFAVNPDNTTEVQANIDNAGYVVNEVVDDILQNMANDSNRPTYNVVSFDYVNNYGAFPENIRQQLVEILSSGTKIWYDTASYIAS